MLCIETGKDVGWIEIYLKEKYKTTFNSYLGKYYVSDEIYLSTPNKVYCDECESYVGWLQGHLKKIHNVSLEEYISTRFTLKEDFVKVLSTKVQALKKNDLRIEKVRQENKKNFKISKSEQMVIDYRAGKLPFRKLYDAWSSKLSCHARRNAYTLQSLSQYESYQDLNQELLEAFSVAINTYDVSRGVRFSTYMYQCIRNKSTILKSKADTTKRKITEISFSNIPNYNNPDHNGSDAEANYLACAGGPEHCSIAGEYDYIDFMVGLSQLKLNDIQKTIVQEILNEKTKSEICKQFNISLPSLNFNIKKLQRILIKGKIINENDSRLLKV